MCLHQTVLFLVITTVQKSIQLGTQYTIKYGLKAIKFQLCYEFLYQTG